MDSDFPNDASDEELVQQVQKNDQRAFTQLFHKYNAAICRHLMYLVKDNEDAQDLAQRTFEKAYTTLATLKNPAAFRSWLYRIATNLARDDLRAKKKRPWLSREEELTEEREAFDAQEQVVQTALMEMAWEMTRAKLNTTQIACFILHNQGLRPGEIASTLHLSEGTVRTYLSKVYPMLRAAFQYQQDCSEDA